VAAVRDDDARPGGRHALVQLEQWEAAVNVLDAGIRGIEKFLEEYNQKEKAGRLEKLNFCSGGSGNLGEDPACWWESE